MNTETQRQATDSAATTEQASMRAVFQTTYGSADVLQVGAVPLPRIRPDQVLIEVATAGLDRGVWHLMTGMPYLVRIAGYGLTKPKTPVPGLDVSGRVLEVGKDVTRFAVGDEVFGIANGSFATYATADADKLAHKPADISFEHAGVAAVSGITALQALTTVGRVKAGERVLVVGASGGVGSFAVQIAKALGAKVTGIASTAKLDLVRSLGAEDVIDYTRQDITDAGRFDLIIDTGGRNPVRTLRKALTPTGTLVIVGGEGGGKLTGGIGRQLRAKLLSPFVKQRLTFFMSEESHRFIEPLADYLADGSVVPAIGESYPLDRVPTAIRRMEAGELAGKTLITVAGTDA